MNLLKQGDHATLVITTNDRIFIPVILNYLIPQVRRIIDTRMFLIEKTIEEIIILPLHDKIRELFKIYHLSYSNLNIYHSSYMGIYEENNMLYAVFLSVRTPPKDLWDSVIVVDDKEFERIVEKVEYIRTRILGEDSELIGIISRSVHLEKLNLVNKFN